MRTSLVLLQLRAASSGIAPACSTIQQPAASRRTPVPQAQGCESTVQIGHCMYAAARNMYQLVFLIVPDHGAALMCLAYAYARERVTAKRPTRMALDQRLQQFVPELPVELLRFTGGDKSTLVTPK